MEKYNATYYRKKFGYNSDTVDAVVMSVMNEELCFLLIKRKNAPYKDFWALPGGFIDREKDIDTLASIERELKEETGLEKIYLEQLKTYTRKYRDPREKVADELIRIFSVAHFALVDYTKINKLKASSDAKEVKWFKLSELPDNLAFDHKEIIDDAITRIRGKLTYSAVVFELLPETFTIPELQKMIESILGQKLDRNNFRTKILSQNFLDKASTKKIKKIGKPAQYYRFNQYKFEKNALKNSWG